MAGELNCEASKRRVKAPVHIKIDTGMRRIGVDIREAYDFIRNICVLKNIKIEGIFTHFPCADTKQEFTRKQIVSFSKLIEDLEKVGVCIPLRHTANSLGAIKYPQSYFNLVRPGLMIYGLHSRVIARSETTKQSLRPVLTLKTKIIYLKEVPKGAGISYGHTFVAARKTRVATLPIGYGDGYSRSLSNKAYCLVNGARAKIIGRVCMDQAMIDVTHIKNVSVGDEVVLIGRQGNQGVSVEELAALAGTIPYEIVCNLGDRIKRVYL